MKFFALILFFLSFWAIDCQMRNHLKGYKVECTFSDKYIVNGSCSLKPVNRRSSAFTLYAYLIKPIDSLMVAIRVFRRYNTFLPFPVNITVNPCDYISGKKKSPLFNVVKLYLDKYTNLNHSCPYSGPIIVKNVEFIPLNNFPLIVPEGIYRVDVRAFKDIEENSISLGRAYLEVKEEKS